jgi:hypothetical protein
MIRMNDQTVSQVSYELDMTRLRADKRRSLRGDGFPRLLDKHFDLIGLNFRFADHRCDALLGLVQCVRFQPAGSGIHQGVQGRPPESGTEVRSRVPAVKQQQVSDV